MFFPEKLPKVTLKEKLILWDKDFENCEVTTESKQPSTVSEVVFSTRWSKDIFQHWKFTENRGGRFRRPKRRKEEREYENWEVINGLNYRTWRIHPYSYPVTFACGDKYYPSVEQRKLEKTHKECREKHLSCVIEQPWRIHPTGKERQSTTVCTRKERNPKWKR